MKATKSHTPGEAVALCHQFSSLIGKIMVCEPTHFFVIESVVVSPFDEEAKNVFAKRLMESSNPLESISFYKGSDFDVLVFARSVSDKQVVIYESLHNYLAHESIDLTGDDIPSYVM